jgi:hypothetical protein
MTATIVYVHGNGNKVREDLLKAQWDEALFGRDMAERSRMAYWRPLRYPEPLPDPAFDEVDQLPVSPLAAAAPPEVLPTPEFVAAVEGAGGGLEATTALHDWLERMSYAADAVAEGEAAMPPPTSPFEALPFPRALRTAAFRTLVARTFVDVHAYFFGGMAEPMRAVLRGVLDDIEGPVIVLAHSLGTIIAYDVLREARAEDREIPLFLTVGSPLGVQEVQDLIVRPLEVPAGVAAWRNVSDWRDVVALDHTLRPAYAPPDRCTDFMVTNDSANHHGIREYLRTVPVREPVLELMRGAPVL